MMPQKLQKYYPHLIAILLFLGIAFIYMSPAIEGKLISQSDVTIAKGQQAEMAKYIKETGDYTLWTNSMFSGMPVYQISMAGVPNNNIFKYLATFIRFKLPTYSVDILFLYLIGFYVLLLSFRVSPYLSILGAVAFALSSYNLIYIEAGHVNKALAIAMMPPALSGVILILRKKYLIGGLIFCLFFGIQIAYNHIQISYYLFLTILIIGIVELIYSIREKTFKHFLISASILIIATILSLLPNTMSLYTSYEFSKESQRGGSELVENESGSEKSGLDKDYAFAWSYGKAEAFTILIPNFQGGPSYAKLSTKSNLYKALLKNNVPQKQAKQYISLVPTYWGGKTTTAGPFYYGSIICFLFVLGLFLSKGKLKWWVATISLLAILWSWGGNFEIFNTLFFKYFPLFNKFRVPETFLVITSLTFPLLAVLALKQLSDKEMNDELKKKFVLRSYYIVGGISLFFALFGKGLFDFVSLSDKQLEMQQVPNWFINALQDDRAQLLRKDAFRSFIYISLAFGTVWLFIVNKIEKNYLIAILAILILVDLWSVDKRYLNSDDFKNKKAARQVTPNQANLEIMKDPDPDFRVFNLMQDPFNESFTSNFHKSIGGYHAAKIARYQDIITHHLSKQNMNVINMLNTKYFIVPDNENRQPRPYLNQDACGNSWFVQDLKFVENPKEEIDALTDFSPLQTAIVDKKYRSYFDDKDIPDTISNANTAIILTSYKPDELEYVSDNSSGGFAVFSEIYYNDNKGWKAYIDGKHVPHIRVNYVLRGLYIPPGKHTIEFKFEPQSYFTTQKISLGSSVVIGLLFLFIVGLSIWKGSKSAMPEIESKET